jgi:cyclo(L-tyrosyl-L-tyrosyl) synthase
MKETNLNTYPVIGMSPGNSYFQDETVVFLLKEVVNQFGKTGVLIPDVPAIATYRALGYSENRARRDKAIPKGNALRNKVKRAMQELGYNDDQVRVFDWNQDIASQELYAEKLKKIEVLYENNSQFRQAIRLATKEVLVTSDQEPAELEAAVDIAVHYILSEFACLELLSEHLQVEKVVYIYHKRWPAFEKYIAGDFDQIPKSHLGFLQIKKES